MAKRKRGKSDPTKEKPAGEQAKDGSSAAKDPQVGESGQSAAKPTKSKAKAKAKPKKAAKKAKAKKPTKKAAKGKAKTKAKAKATPPKETDTAAQAATDAGAQAGTVGPGSTQDKTGLAPVTEF